MVDATAHDDAHPLFDKPRIEAAVNECLRRTGLAARPIRWFPDARSARSYLQPYEPHKAYRPFESSALLAQVAAWHEIAWQATASTVLEPRRSLGTDNGSRPILFAVGRTLRHFYDDFVSEELPVRLGEALRRLELNGSEFIPVQIPLKMRAHELMLAAFTVGLFGFRVGQSEVVCFPRPTLWIAAGRLHRTDGPAVEWATGEGYFFWRGTPVPNWIFEHPERITIDAIRTERNVERRRCMIERFGSERFLLEAGARLINRDSCGSLWRVIFDSEEPYTMVEVENGTPEEDGTRRRYFLQVPPGMRSAREAVAWSYGLAPEQYQIAMRT
jgi:hypothetical protein